MYLSINQNITKKKNQKHQKMKLNSKQNFFFHFFILL